MASKDRLSIPIAIRRRLSWLHGAVAEGLLVVLQPEGSAELSPWHRDGDRMMTEVRRLLGTVDEHRRGELAIAAMDRYMKLSLEAEGRIVLPDSLLAHLDALTSSVLRLVTRDQRLWLWSESEWRRRRHQRLSLVEEVDSG